jgi:hypothetical protein
MRGRSHIKRKAPVSGSPPKALVWDVPRWQALVSGAFLLALVIGAWAWRNWDRADAAFQHAAAQGQTALSEVESLPSEGREHVPQGHLLAIERIRLHSAPIIPFQLRRASTTYRSLRGSSSMRSSAAIS